MKVGVVSDTGSDIPKGFEGSRLVRLVPLIFRFGTDEYYDRSITVADFLQRVSIIWPTTSAPSPGDYLKAFKEVLQNNESVICITVDSQYSSSFSSAMVASQYFETGKVTVLDSASLSIVQGFLALKAVKEAQQGKSPEIIVDELKKIQTRCHLYITLDTVDFLIKSGKASRLTGAIAGFLKIRPIFCMEEGELKILDKTRSRGEAKRRLINLATQHFPADFVAVGHVQCEDEANEIAIELGKQTKFPKENIFVFETGTIIAMHSGPGTLGIMVVSH